MQSWIRRGRFLGLLLFSQLVVAQTAGNAGEPRFGVLLMAHGGSPAWNEEVLQAVETLHDRHPIEVAFGMADAESLERAVRALEADGVTHGAVVRLFVSGESWYQRTRQILGMEPGAPDKPAAAAAETRDVEHNEQDGPASMPMGFWRIASSISFALSEEGLMEAVEMDGILMDRAAALSTDPALENVLILAHGPRDDAENARWIAELDGRANRLRRALPFHQVVVMTLREDWPEQREIAQRQVRDFIQAGSDAGHTTLVLPFRVQGFGPYADVLAGLPYRADQTGLLPHPNVSRWIERQSTSLHRQLDVQAANSGKQLMQQ